MRLTPAEVHNVAFKKPSIGKRGYDEDEVDAFLDLVEDELARLIEENNELTTRLAAYESGATPAPAPAAPVAEPAAAETTAAPTPAPAAAPASSTEDIGTRAARLLGLAQDTADRLTAEAKEEADSTLSAARAESDKLLADARSESETLRSEATSETDKLRADAKAESDKLRADAKADSDKVRADAKSESDALLSDAKAEAEATREQSQKSYDEAMSSLNGQQAALQRKIEDLRVYEREYRSRLRSWITDQLEQLESEAATTASGNGTAE